MRRNILVILIMLCFMSLAFGQSAGPVKIIYSTKVDVSPPIRDLAASAPPFVAPDEVPNKPSIYRGEGSGASVLDPVLQTAEGFRTFGPPLQNFAGNTTSSNPPDTNGEVGPNHYVQTVNVTYGVFEKNGTRLIGPTATNVLWTGFGGNCEFTNRGDPIVLYDQLADRWIISQFTNPGAASATQCFAVSTTGDPTGSFFRYEFPTPGNDYPKFSVWDDGGSQSAILGGIRNFSGGFQFDAYAFERDAMLAGNAAEAVVFNLSALVPGANNFLPSDISGTTLPPSGTPGLFVGVDDPSTVQNELEMLELEVDWNTPANSTLTRLPDVAVAAFDGNVCFFNRSCIPQPNTNVRVDGFADAMMFRLPYRNFGSHQSIVCTHAVDVGDFNDHSGIRWHELRNTGGGWSLHQEGTFSPDADHRWMPSIEINGNGDIMVGYSVSSRTTFPSLRYTGRLAGDPLGQMTFQEGLIAAGLGSQTSSNRWGDYHDMTVDPSDDLTFWYTGQYQTQQGGSKATRIASMQANTAPQLVEITASPVPGEPVIIGPGGGFFDIDVTVDNNGSSTLNAQIWNTVTLPIGEEVGQLIGPINFSVGPGSSFNTTVTMEIPPAPPPNTYQYNMKVGTFPNVQLDRDTFNFIKTTSPSNAVELYAGPENDWGWATNQSPRFAGKDNTEASNGDAAVPEELFLEQNYPNPFNPSTVIRYGLDQDASVRVKIFNALGQEVRTLFEGFQSAGTHSVNWDGTNATGQTVSAGVYVYRLEAGNEVQIKKMIFSK